MQLSDFGSAIGSVVTGGAAGLLGVVVNRVADYFNQKQKIEADKLKNAHELALREQDMKITQIEAESRYKVAEIDAESRESVADAAAFAASYQLEPQRFSDPTKLSKNQNWLFAVLDLIRGLVRPGLTVYLAILTSIIIFQSLNVLRSNQMTLDPEKAYALVEESMNTVLFLFTVCTMWYFGTRNKASEAAARRKP